jgi:tetratricopeptide (TPR) repeat protein
LNGVLSSSDLVATHVNRGIIHALRADYSKALSDYDRAISLDPDEAEAFLNKGLLLLRTANRDREALEAIDSAITKNTSKPALAYFARAVAHEGLGHTEAAYRDFQRAATLDPQWQLPLRELSRFKKRG